MKTNTTKQHSNNAGLGSVRTQGGTCFHDTLDSGPFLFGGYQMEKDAQFLISKVTLKKRRLKLISTPTNAQKIATKRVKRVAWNVFKFKVEREWVLRPYIIDIFIPAISVAIEIDGSVHNDSGSYDDRRDQYLKEKYKVTVIRFKNEDIDTDYFLDAIWEICFTGLSKYIGFIKEQAGKRGKRLPEIFNPFANAKFRKDFECQNIFDEM